jgi:serine protease Do
MEIGDRVLAVGAPFGLEGSVTAGIVSAKGRNGFNPDRAVYEDYLQTDAAINPGNSGGPLVNLEGKVIGINTAIRTRSGGWQGVGLAITSNVAKSIVEQLTHDGVVHRGYLGIGITPLKPEVAEALGLEGKKGLLVTQVQPGSPAAKAGIKIRDIIVSMAGKAGFQQPRELQRLVSSLPVHQEVTVNVIRDGKTLEIPVTIEEQPQDYGVASLERGSKPAPSEEANGEISVDKFGFDVAELTPELAKKYGYKSNVEGIFVTDVEAGSAAEEAGLVRGMLITKINRKSVASPEEVRRTLQKAPSGKGVLFQVEYPQRAGGGSGYVVIKPQAIEK